MDVGFLLDVSGSMQEGNLVKEIDFMTKLVEKYEVGEDAVKFATVVFSSRPTVKFDFNRYDTKDEILEAVRGITYPPRGWTNTHEGLRAFRTKVFTAAGGQRPGVPRVLLLMTDGNANSKDRTSAEAKLIKDMGIDLFVIGFGTTIDVAQLRRLASKKGDGFYDGDFDKLTDVIEDLASKTCEGKPQCSMIYQLVGRICVLY